MKGVKNLINEYMASPLKFMNLHTLQLHVRFLYIGCDVATIFA